MAVPVVGVGDVVSADLLNSFNSGKLTSQPLGVIARGKRTSNTGTFTAETGVVRLDGMPVYAGRLYTMNAPRVRASSSVTSDRVKFNLRYSFSGAATTSSTLAARAEGISADSLGIPAAILTPVSDATLSFIITCQRISGGTGNITVQCINDDALDYFLEDMGLDPGDTGVTI